MRLVHRSSGTLNRPLCGKPQHLSLFEGRLLETACFNSFPRPGLKESQVRLVLLGFCVFLPHLHVIDPFPFGGAMTKHFDTRQQKPLYLVTLRRFKTVPDVAKQLQNIIAPPPGFKVPFSLHASILRLETEIQCACAQKLQFSLICPFSQKPCGLSTCILPKRCCHFQVISVAFVNRRVPATRSLCANL